MTQRIEQIKQWLKDDLQADIRHFEPASNDASFRRYFRVSFNNCIAEQAAGQSFIVMDAPPNKEPLSAFIVIDRHLQNLGIHVPRLFVVNETDGFILMSDLGGSSYLSVLNSDAGGERVDKLYADAMSALVVMQQQCCDLPVYDANLLRAEMQLLPDWYIKVHCQATLTDVQRQVWEQAMTLLVQSAQEQPQVFVHRDYHSRNLMFYAEHNPGVIDFQDAVIGPVCYDLVSLLRDSYIAWPDEKVYEWLEQYRCMLLKEELLSEDNKAQFIRWFDWMGIQRQLKVVGIFCRLNYRDGKANYLADIPQTLTYLLNTCARYSEFDDLRHLLMSLDRQVQPSAELSL